MSTVKVNAIRSTSGTSDAITLNSSSGVTAINGNALRAQNLAQNGAMTVAQRGTSSTENGIHTVDRFSVKYSGADEAPTQAQVALTSSDTGPWAKGFRYALQITNGNQTSGAGAADYIYIEHRIEAQDMAQSGWEYTSASSYVTLSFWVKASVAQNYYGYVRTSDGTGQIYTFETGALTADTWTKITKTIPGHANLQFDNNAEQGFKIFLVPFWGTDSTGSTTLNTWGAYGSGTTRVPDMTSTWWTTNDATFEITGVQLEVGPTASEYMHESYGETLAKCQRYYYRHVDDTNDAIGVGGWYTASLFTSYVGFPVTMRTAPTLEKTSGTNYYRVWSGGTNQDGDDVAMERNSNTGCVLDFTGNFSGTAGNPGNINSNNAATKISFTAEL